MQLSTQAFSKGIEETKREKKLANKCVNLALDRL